MIVRRNLKMHQKFEFCDVTVTEQSPKIYFLLAKTLFPVSCCNNDHLLIFTSSHRLPLTSVNSSYKSSLPKSFISGLPQSPCSKLSKTNTRLYSRWDQLQSMREPLIYLTTALQIISQSPAVHRTLNCNQSLHLFCRQINLSAWTRSTSSCYTDPLQSLLWRRNRSTSQHRRSNSASMQSAPVKPNWTQSVVHVLASLFTAMTTTTTLSSITCRLFIQPIISLLFLLNPWLEFSPQFISETPNFNCCCYVYLSIKNLQFQLHQIQKSVAFAAVLVSPLRNSI